MDDIVEQALRGAALWDEVKDKLKRAALALSGGQQQRLCIARALAVRARSDPHGRAVLRAGPDRHLEDRRPDGRAGEEYTIVIVTHNMQQAARVSDKHRVLHRRGRRAGRADGRLVEYDDTPRIFTNPGEKRTEDYITGRFG